MTVLATADNRRLRYAPLTFWVWGGVLIAAGTVWKILKATGVKPWRLGFVRRLAEAFGGDALWVSVPLALAAMTALGVAGALGLHALTWSRYRLERTAEGGLTVRRGLSGKDAVSIAPDQLCGVALREPLLLRAGGGASVRAVAGGLGNRDQNRTRSVVLPPSPKAEAERVCAGVLGEGVDVAGLRGHPRAGLRRRVVAALGWWVLPVIMVLAVLGWLLALPVLLACAAGWALAATPVALVLARDAYRGLGHAVRGRYLVVRSGTFGRETVTLARNAVQAWTFTDTPFALRAGVVTLTAAVPGGEDGYRIRDMSAAEATEFAEYAAPGIVREFLIDTDA
ncbi:PH domain-containing protein [Streptomyces triculaminicus]|uniref:PH domain-containing protein n=1 Tax=Streptomyces triculaminicus TaxID=2816232 RepID=UPI0037D6C654